MTTWVKVRVCGGDGIIEANPSSGINKIDLFVSLCVPMSLVSDKGVSQH